MYLSNTVLDFLALLLHYLHRSTLSSLRARPEFRPHIPSVQGRSRFNHLGCVPATGPLAGGGKSAGQRPASTAAGETRVARQAG